jgi:DNA-binding response OmpR family regulator
VTSGPTRTALILVVERDPHVRGLEEYFLREAGYEIAFAGSGEEALELVRRHRPGVVITEVLVPGIDGLALCRRIREDRSADAPRILVFSFLACEERAREAGADDFLLKPLSDRALQEAVSALLRPDGKGEDSPALQEETS